MNATLLLADFVQVSEGKMTAVGIGWTFTGPGRCSFGVGALIDVAWTEADRPHTFVLQLLDEDGHPVLDPAGRPVAVEGTFDVGRPPGHPHGAEFIAPLAMNFAGLDLPASTRFVWVLSIDGRTESGWSAPFSTRPWPVG